jgi:hypothetical protein
MTSSAAKGHCYLTVVVDSTPVGLSGPPGGDSATVEKFLDLLGTTSYEQHSLIFCEMAESITTAIAHRCPNAIRWCGPV